MKPLPLAIQTLYADLVQQAHSAPAEAGSVYTQTIKGIDYLYVRTTVGGRAGTGSSGAPTIRRFARGRKQPERKPSGLPKDAETVRLLRAQACRLPRRSSDVCSMR